MSPEAPPSDQPIASPTSGVNEPWAKSWIQPDFTLDHKALDRMPDHLKPLRSTLERQKSFEDVLTVMQNQQVLNGKKALAPLPVDAPDAVKAERKTLLDTINGVPSKPEDYGIKKPDDLPDNVWSKPLVDGATAWAHKHSVSPSALKELVDLNLSLGRGNMAEQANQENQFWAGQQQAFEATIKRENIPGDRAAALVEKGAIALGLDLSDKQTQTFLKGASARLMAMRHAIAIGEDKAIGSPGGGGEGKNYGEMANSAIHNKADPLYEQYWNREGKFPRAVQESAVAKVNEWFKLDAAKRHTDGRRR